MYKAILFDFDGTLAPTVVDIAKAWQAVLVSHGVPMKLEDYYELEGMNLHMLTRRLFEKYGQSAPEDTAGVVSEKELEFLKRHTFAFYPGVEELLGDLRRAQTPTAVVTASLRTKMDALLSETVRKLLDALVTGDEGLEGKPAPAQYLRAAELVGVAPPSCVVVENAPLGIEAAKAAGMYCIALETTLPAKHLSCADEIIGRFDQLRNSPAIRSLL